MDLPHIPLFEGEENLKLLAMESNFITKIDHLVSLNNLLYLNLYNNRITEIENLSTLPKLKALMLGKNQIEKIKNINNLIDLGVLDLHSNRIKVIQNLSNLRKLRLLNLANNQITNFADLTSNPELEEVNLRKNMIVVVPSTLVELDKLKKLNLSRNLISKVDSLETLRRLKNLTDLVLEDNPVLMIKEATDIAVQLPIKNKNFASPTKPSKSTALAHTSVPSNIVERQEKAEVMDEDAVDENYLETINHISKEWAEEYSKLIQMGFNGYNNRKVKETQVVSAHAEVECENKLKIFGNAMEVLDKNDLYKEIEVIYFKCFSFDLLASSPNLNKIKKFERLKEIQFSSNNLHSFYQIIKFEEIDSIVAISVKKNEICQCVLLKHFLLYRYHKLSVINGVEHKEKDKKFAKRLFGSFDDAISEIEVKKKKQVDLEEVRKKVEETRKRREFLNFAEMNIGSVLDQLVNL